MKIEKRPVILALAILVLTGCSFQLVATYDPASVQQMEKIEKQIDAFYSELLTTPEPKRIYAEREQGYFNIHVEIRAFVRRQQRREMNAETTEQAKMLEAFWQQDMAQHQQRDTLSTFLITRRQHQYQRLLNSMFKGELAKR